MGFVENKTYPSVQAVLEEHFGDGIRICKTDRVGGGDINDAFSLTLSDGTVLFLKKNRKENFAFFSAEAAGLSAIAATGTVQTPKLLGYGIDESGKGDAFLILEWCQGRDQISGYWETFAQELAAMHHAPADSFGSVEDSGGLRYGFRENNFIGGSRQINTPSDSWISFFREDRLRPQMKWASGYLRGAGMKKLEKLMERLDDLLIEPEQPSLLHGDLWSGNFITGPDGRAWLIDPAVYVGHAEADLAMTELFGGFSSRFYQAYREAAPLEPGYEDRRDLYNLYHMLNHLNLFGGGYLSSVMRIVNRYV